MLIDLAFLAVLTSVGYYVWTYAFPEGCIPSGVDDSAHYFKVWFLSYCWDVYRIIPRWCNFWYSGYPILIFHGPLSYYLALLLHIVLNIEPLNAYKLVDFAGYILLSYGCYFLTREIGGKPVQGFISGFIILFAPAILNNLILTGRYPFTVSIGLIPLAIISFLHLCREGSSKIWFPLTVLLESGVILAHISGFIFMGLILGGLILADLKKTIFIRRIVFFILTSALSLVICIWWLFPFFIFYNYAHPEWAGCFASHPLSIIERATWAQYVGISLVISIPFALLHVMSGETNRSKHERKLIIAALLASILIFAGWWLSYFVGRSPTLSKLSFLMIFRMFDRAYVIMTVPLSLLWGLSYPYLPDKVLKGMRPRVRLLVSVLLMITVFGAVMSDSRLFLFTSAFRLPQEWRLIPKYKGEGRVLVWDYNSPLVPMVTEKNHSANGRNEVMIVGGWHPIAAVGETYPLEYGLHNLANAKNNPGSFYNLLRNAGVSLLVIGKKNVPKVYVDSIVKNRWLNKTYEDEKYLFLRFTDSNSYAEHVEPFLVITSLISFHVLRDSLFISPHADDLHLVWAETQKVRKTSSEMLKDYRLLVLYDFEVEGGEHYGGWPVLRRYVEEGGRMLIFTDPSNIKEASFLPEPFPAERIFFGTLGSIFNGSISIPHINVSLFASKGTLSYTEENYLRPGSKVLLEDSGKPVIVKRSYGRGFVIWCGFNFPYHTISTGNQEEKKLLVSLFKMILSGENDKVNVQWSRNSPESIDLTLESAGSSRFILVKETYFPPWKAYDENGKPLRIYKNQWSRILIKVKNQTRKIKLRYEWDPINRYPTAISLVGISIPFLYPIAKKFLEKR